MEGKANQQYSKLTDLIVKVNKSFLSPRDLKLASQCLDRLQKDIFDGKTVFVPESVEELITLQRLYIKTFRS